MMIHSQESFGFHFLPLSLVLRNLALYGSFGLLVLLRALIYPFEFIVGRLPKKYRKIVGPYLEETLEILLRPFSFGLDSTAFVVKFVLFGQFHQFRARLL